MPELVADGASLECTMGTSPGTLSIATTCKTNCDNVAAATVQDSVPSMNIGAFGMCNSMSNPQVASATAAAQGVLTPQPCLPVVSAPWSPGSSSVMIANQAALTPDSTCNCQWGGVIKISDPGQKTTEVG